MHKQVNLGQDVMQSQALQSLQLHDVCEEQLRDGQPFQNMLQGDFKVRFFHPSTDRSLSTWSYTQA